MIYWFTGQPSHGKTTLANLLVLELQLQHRRVIHVDGDKLRRLEYNVDYSPTGRRDNVKTAQKIADYLHNETYDVVVSLVSPYRDQREEFKNHIGSFIIEFYVHTEEERERDGFKSQDYEPPLDDYVDVDTTNISPEDSIKKILEEIKTIIASKNLLI